MGVTVQMRLIILPGSDEPPPHSLAQASGNITLNTGVVIGTSARGCLNLQIVSGTFSYHVNRGGGIAGTGHQTIGTAHHFHPLESISIDIPTDIAIGHL